MIRSEWVGKLWQDEDGIVYLNTHDSGPSLAMGANAFELADMVASNAIGKRVRIVIETIDDVDASTFPDAAGDVRNAGRPSPDGPEVDTRLNDASGNVESPTGTARR